MADATHAIAAALAPAFTASVYAKWSILFRHYVNDSIEIE
jgi:hypothetical protein